MKFKTLTNEEIETMSFDDLAYAILKEKGKKMKTADIFKTICELLKMSDQEYESRIADFFTLLATEKRFIQLDKGFWDLRENHSSKVEIEDIDEEEIDDIIEDDDTVEQEEDMFIDETKEVDDDETEDELKDFVVIDDENDGEL